MARYPLRKETIEDISAAQVPVQLPTHRQLAIALEVAEQAMALAYAADFGDLWYRAWTRAEDLRRQLKTAAASGKAAASHGAQSSGTMSAPSAERANDTTSVGAS